tara:strand:- start:31551 stop:33047 length:1497 start_codon:yes stop_codon:yes gene_type:complete
MKIGKLGSIWKKFQSDRSGNFAITFALSSVAIFLSVGLAVDYSQSIGNRTRVTNALDSATLATARALSIGDVRERDAEDYLKVIFASNLGIDSLEDLNKSKFRVENININKTNQTVTASASYDQQMMFMPIGSEETHLAVAGISAASYGQSEIEVAMVLDVTGSMAGSRIRALKEAAQLGVEQLLAVNTDEDEYVRVSLVPYSDSVNAGPLAKYVYPDYNEAKSNAPVYDPDLYSDTGIGYDVEPFQEDLEECETTRKKQGRGKNKQWVTTTTCDLPDDYVGKDNGASEDDCATDRKAPKSGTSYQYTDANPSYGMISRDSRLSKNACTNSEIVLLTSNESKLKNAISNLSTGGCTGGHMGLQWAWYTISHRWADFVPASSAPGNRDENADLTKFIILMTDGEFNKAYAGTDSQDTGCNQSSLSETHTDYLCDAIKAQKIKIFTVGFQTSRSAENLLKSCATPDEGQLTYHYEPDTTAELEQTYEDIANTIRSLRLTL